MVVEPNDPNERRGIAGQPLRVAGSGLGKRSARPTGPCSFLRRLRKIIGREAEFLAQFAVKIFENGSQFGFDSFARLRFCQLGELEIGFPNAIHTGVRRNGNHCFFE